MDAYISKVLHDSDYMRPQFIKRVAPICEIDSGFRIFLGPEVNDDPAMMALSGVEDFFKDMGIWWLVYDLKEGYRVDMTSTIEGYPRVHYRRQTFSFSYRGLVATDESQNGLKGMEFFNNCYMLPFMHFTFEEKLKIAWDDRKLIDLAQ